MARAPKAKPAPAPAENTAGVKLVVPGVNKLIWNGREIPLG